MRDPAADLEPGRSRLVATSQIRNNCNWANVITDAAVEGRLQASPGSALGQALVDEYNHCYGDTNFHIHLTPTDRYPDLRIWDQTISLGNIMDYHFRAVLAR